MASMVSSLPLALSLHRLHRLRPQPVTQQLVRLQAAIQATRRVAVRRPAAKTRGTGDEGFQNLIEDFSQIFFYAEVDSNILCKPDRKPVFGCSGISTDSCTHRFFLGGCFPACQATLFRITGKHSDRASAATC